MSLSCVHTISSFVVFCQPTASFPCGIGLPVFVACTHNVRPPLTTHVPLACYALRAAKSTKSPGVNMRCRDILRGQDWHPAHTAVTSVCCQPTSLLFGFPDSCRDLKNTRRIAEIEFWDWERRQHSLSLSICVLDLFVPTPTCAPVLDLWAVNARWLTDAVARVTCDGGMGPE